MQGEEVTRLRCVTDVERQLGIRQSYVWQFLPASSSLPEASGL
jgi:hypothetical protein